MNGNAVTFLEANGVQTSDELPHERFGLKSIQTAGRGEGVNVERFVQIELGRAFEGEGQQVMGAGGSSRDLALRFEGGGHCSGR